MKEVSVNLTYLRELAGGDSRFMAEMIALFLKQTPTNVSNLITYLQQHDWENSKKLAHKMTSGVALMGIKDLQDFLSELQLYSKKQINLDLLPVRVSELQNIHHQATLELQKALNGLTKNNLSRKS